MLKSLIAAAKIKAADVIAMLRESTIETYRKYAKRAEEIAKLKPQAAKLAKLVKEHKADAETLAEAVNELGELTVDGITLSTRKEPGSGNGTPGYKQLIEAIAAYDADFGQIAQQLADKLIEANKAAAAAEENLVLVEAPAKVQPAGTVVS